jgi:hypothetical protein
MNYREMADIRAIQVIGYRTERLSEWKRVNAFKLPWHAAINGLESNSITTTAGNLLFRLLDNSAATFDATTL